MRIATTVEERCKTLDWQYYVYRRIHDECQKAITKWYDDHPHKGPIKLLPYDGGDSRRAR